MWVVDQCGWGARGAEKEPPLASPRAAEACRAVALRVAVELLSDPILGAEIARRGAVEPLFVRPSSPDDDPHRPLARLLGLVGRLVARELPRVGRLIRCESGLRETWERAPSGGHVDVAKSVRAGVSRSGDSTPAAWAVRRVERLVATPVNRLIAAVLRDLERVIRRLSAAGSGAWVLLDRERSVMSVGLAALRRFFSESPLGTLALAAGPPEALFAEALHRRGELARFEGLLSFWQELRATELAALRALSDEEPLRDLPADACYEMSCAMGLVLALRARFPAEPTGAPELFAFRAPGGALRVTFSAGMDRAFAHRPWTALLSLPDGRGVIVEARAAAAHAVSDLARSLDLECRASGGGQLAFLLTPSPDAARSAGSTPAFRWRSFLGGVRDGGPANPALEWSALLDEILTSQSKGA